MTDDTLEAAVYGQLFVTKFLACSSVHFLKGHLSCIGATRQHASTRSISSLVMLEPTSPMHGVKAGIRGYPAGRSRRGLKLNAEAVADVRRRVAAGASQREAAEAHGVDQSLISRIVRGQRWATV